MITAVYSEQLGLFLIKTFQTQWRIEKVRMLCINFPQVIASFILENKTEYNEVILGKPTTEYAEWICKRNSWGGAIELAIFSQIYEKELVAFDVIHMKTYVFGKRDAFAL